MTFALPAANNAHVDDPDINARLLTLIGSPSSVSAKAAGNLPITATAGQWNGNSAGSVKGAGYEFQASQSPYDVSSETKLLLWHSQFNAPNRIQVNTVANGGCRARIYSGSGSMPSAYKEYYLGGNDTPWAECIKGHVPFVIDLNDTTHDASGGSFDNTDVTSYAYLTLRFNMAGSNTNWNYMSSCFVIDTTKSSSATPTFSGTGSSFDDAVTLIQGSDYTDKLGNWVRRIGSVVFIDMPFRIGNNSTQTTFNDGGLTIISPVANDSSDPRIRVTTQAFRVYLNLRNNAADTATFSGTYVWQVRSPWDFDQDDAAVVTLNGPTFRGMGQFTLGSSITGPATWDDVDPVVFADTGVDVDGSTFRNPNGSHLLELTAGAMDIANQRFESYSGAHALLIDTAGTYNFDNVFFDQTGTNDIETTHGSGTVTINLSNGSTVPTVTETGAGAVVINNNVTTTLSGIPAGAEWRLYVDSAVPGEVGTTELDGDETKASGADVDYVDNYASDTSVVLQVIADGFEEYQDYFTLGANPQTRTVTLVPDANT